MLRLATSVALLRVSGFISESDPAPRASLRIQEQQVEAQRVHICLGSAPSSGRSSQFIEATRPDDLMITVHIYNQAARLRSVELIAQVR